MRGLRASMRASHEAGGAAAPFPGDDRHRADDSQSSDVALSHFRDAFIGLFAICAPCQPFTRLSRKELSEKRKRGRKKDSNLLREAALYVARYRPELVLSENVAGIKDPKYGGVWDDFRKHLARLGYATGTKVVCTSKFGISVPETFHSLGGSRKPCTT